MSKEFQYTQFDSAPVKGGLIKLWRRTSTLGNIPRHAEQLLWKDIRQGLKLREIVYSKRINEQNKIEFTTSDQTLIIQRHLGFKELLPMSGKW
mmetsp:Transcript_36586/g.48028  ORF Transcript_36586/g.48028 Transcript_36586/m.48028 type:complete len:93 (+) Transcript_36586:136-414(+)